MADLMNMVTKHCEILILILPTVIYSIQGSYTWTLNEGELQYLSKCRPEPFTPVQAKNFTKELELRPYARKAVELSGVVAPGRARFFLELRCLQEAGFDGIFIRTYRNNCTVEPNAAEFLRTAQYLQRQSDLFINIIHEPCMNKSGAEQFDETWKVLRKAKFLPTDRIRIMLSVERELTGTEWSTNLISNRKLIEDFFWKAMRTRKLYQYFLGVRSTRKEWIEIYGCTTVMTPVIDYWYWTISRKDEKSEASNASSDFDIFGILKRPTYKQYAWNQKICGGHYNLIYH